MFVCVGVCVCVCLLLKFENRVRLFKNRQGAVEIQNSANSLAHFSVDEILSASSS